MPTELVRPTTEYLTSWGEAIADFGSEYMDGAGFFGDDQPDPTPAGLAGAVRRRLAAGTDDPGPDWVRCHFYWIVDGDEVVGHVAVRHPSDLAVIDDIGHIGYSVRPSRRRAGHGTRGLALALPEARALGHERVVLTCDHTNLGSRAVIEANGGRYLKDVDEGRKRHYVIDLTGSDDTRIGP